MEREDLQEDPRFATAEGRRAHRKELSEILFNWARPKTRQELWVKLRDLGYFGAPVLSLDEVIEDPHIKAREAFIWRETPGGWAHHLVGTVDPHVRDPIKHSPDVATGGTTYG